MSCLPNGDRETEISLHRQNDQVQYQGSIGRCGNFDGSNARPCYNENYGEIIVSGISNSSSENQSANSQVDGVCRKARQHKEMTLQDMYNNQNLFDDDDDDSDWEPLQKHVEIVKWFCTNCTMVNFDVAYCDICGEHKESGILKHGCFASPFLQDANLPGVESEIKESNKDIQIQKSAPNNTTAIGFDERMLLHSEVEMKSHPHPERPDRLRAIAASLATAGIFPGKCFPITAREITKEELQMVHSSEHVEAVELTSHLLSSYFTPDTYANEHSACSARLAAGLCADLASAIVSGHTKNGFALVRPPGHHAGVKQAMGFCLHNNAAVAALAAQAAGAKKVLIVDWDVHHGNGTQEIFEQNKSVLYISLHRHEGGKFYPGTGAAYEVGKMGAEGYCVNVPWSRGGVGDNDYIFAFQHVVLPIASEFAPDFTIISAGFDAARGDPLGCCDVTPAGYAQMTHMLSDFSGGKLLVILEGGYNLRSISSSATAVIKVLLDESPECEPENVLPTKAGLLTILEVLKIQMNFWPTLGSNFMKLQSQWGMYTLGSKKNKQTRKRRQVVAPIWWKWGRKCLLYHVLNGHVNVKRRKVD
ncbi:histone deacetylase 15 [Ziziphus jujuba]|uniref:histone deacetylase n=1 Tax=Ziziphus jujuba TaxID=326968 RepID=A0ABM3IIQ4_ZIZJJ|nr:histone deacetylase 15 [Ziziphus jujuba]